MKNLSPSVCHSDDCKEEESLAKCYGLAVQCHSERLCLEESPANCLSMLSAAKHLCLNAQKHEIPHTACAGSG